MSNIHHWTQRPLNHTDRTLEAWVNTKPHILSNERIVPTQAILDAFNNWAKETGELPMNSTELGVSIRKVIKGCRSKQIMRKRVRFMAYVLPPEIEAPAPTSDDFDDLL